MSVYEINDICEYNRENAEAFIQKILKISYKEWFEELSSNYVPRIIQVSEIPQFSNFYIGTVEVVSLLRRLGDYGPTFNKIGNDLLGRGRNKIAYLKYGENHAKLAEQLGLVKTEKDGRVIKVFLSEVGKIFDGLDGEEKTEYLNKVILLMPIIYNITFSSRKIVIKEELMKYLSTSTAIRRGSNVKALMKRVVETYEGFVDVEKYVNLRG